MELPSSTFPTIPVGTQAEPPLGQTDPAKVVPVIPTPLDRHFLVPRLVTPFLFFPQSLWMEVYTEQRSVLFSGLGSCKQIDRQCFICLLSSLQ